MPAGDHPAFAFVVPADARARPADAGDPFSANPRPQRDGAAQRSPDDGPLPATPYAACLFKFDLLEHQRHGFPQSDSERNVVFQRRRCGAGDAMESPGVSLLAGARLANLTVLYL